MDIAEPEAVSLLQMMDLDRDGVVSVDDFMVRSMTNSHSVRPLSPSECRKRTHSFWVGSLNDGYTLKMCRGSVNDVERLAEQKGRWLRVATRGTKEHGRSPVNRETLHEKRPP